MTDDPHPETVADLTARFDASMEDLWSMLEHVRALTARVELLELELEALRGMSQTVTRIEMDHQFETSMRRQMAEALRRQAVKGADHG